MTPETRREVKEKIVRCTDEQLIQLQFRYSGTEHEAVIHEERMRRWRRKKAEERGSKDRK